MQHTSTVYFYSEVHWSRLFVGVNMTTFTTISTSGNFKFTEAGVVSFIIGAIIYIYYLYNILVEFFHKFSHFPCVLSH